MIVCPKTRLPCCDDLCHGSGCMLIDGYPMLELCPVCDGIIDEENPEFGSCACDDDEYPDEEPPNEA